MFKKKIEHYRQIAKNHGFDATVKGLPSQGLIFANINGLTFRIKDNMTEEQFIQKLQYYAAMPPSKPIDLTPRLQRIEEAAIRQIEQFGK